MQCIDLATYIHVIASVESVHLNVVRNNTGTTNCEVRIYEVAGFKLLRGGQL